MKWTDFNSNASKSFQIFRNEVYLHDVTLVSDDQYQTTAHKLVLSASSDYFKNIFKNNRLSKPFLCLDGVSSSDINNILDYIYNGELQIYQDDLDRFLGVAQRFKLEGLIGFANKEEGEEKNDIQHDFYPSVNTIKPEELNFEHTTTDAANTSKQLSTKISLLNTTDLDELDQKLYENMEKTDGGHTCRLCGKTAKLKKDMKYHVETHMEGLAFPCNTCGKEFRSRNSLKYHNYSHNQKLNKY